MNIWKYAFFTLVLVLVGGAGAAYYAITASGERAPVAVAQPMDGFDVTLATSNEELEQVASHFITKALDGKDVPFSVEVDDLLHLTTAVSTFFGETDVTMSFAPIVNPAGQIVLEQKAFKAGRLAVSPSIAMGLVERVLTLPDWLAMYPRDEQIIIDLQKAPLENNLHARAKSIELKDGAVHFDVTIPKGE
ncbi:hypothetical protein BN1050_02438 [Metalysinibacillus saudimassiliensis]|uniref:DUF2140 family protein n=1 Tax=Metalysinibacillus saudimassiliensis TaxID=1461583 RepID=A0A078MGD6_9BACL|nr:hypothetical protein BN1050_02438 [Metalysinibacillus saudimassiliensis]